jgi:hypothetical protein
MLVHQGPEENCDLLNRATFHETFIDLPLSSRPKRVGYSLTIFPFPTSKGDDDGR